MKKLFIAVFAVLAAIASQTVAFADAAPIPKGYRVKQLFSEPIVPIIAAVVIIAIVILIKVIRKNKK